MRIKKYLSPAGALNKRYTNKDFEGTGWHYIPVSDIKKDDKLKDTALKQGESDYLVDKNGYLVPSSVVNNFLKNLGLTTAYDYHYDQLNLSPFTKNLNNYFTLQYDANDRIGQLMKLRAADRKANQLTPGAGTFVVAPLTLTAAGIGGATALPYLLPGTLGGNIIGTTAFGEALNHAIKYGTGKTMGEHAVNAARYLGIPQSLWGDYGIQMLGDMPLYITGDIVGKQVANAGRTLTKEILDQLALDNTFKDIPINPTTKDLAKAINKEVKDKLFVNLVPGLIGWAPRQTLTGYHASNEPIQEFDYWFPNWAVREHNAPHGIYFTANETKPSGGFLAKRPYIEQISSTFDKPMVQVGEIPASAKNTTRNAIERQALSMGADGIIYQGIKDNQLENQTIVKTLNPDLRVTVSEIIENDPYLITKILDNEKIRLRLPTHTKDLPREIVLEPQGNNQYRIHIRTWNGDHVPANLDSKEKLALFESVYNELPEGAEILFPESSIDYPATRGTVAALTHLSRDPRFQRGNTTGTLIYADKNGNLQTFTGNSFIKRQKPLNSHLLGEVSAGKYGEFYPKIESDDIKWITDEFSNIYETTPLTLYTTPILEQVSDDTIALGIGEFNLSDTTKAFTDIMKKRWNLYNYKFSDNDITPISDSNFLSYILGDGNRTFHTIDWIFDNIKNKKQILYTPTTDHSWGGFHIRENDSNWIRWNPRISHIPTTIHETISHGTDPIVRNFVTNTRQPVLGKSTVSTLQWNPETGEFETMSVEMPSLYEELSYPIDIFNPGKVADTVTGDAVKDNEARASNWEMIANLYNRIAKERGITPQEAFQIPDSEFHSYVDNLSNEDIIDLLKTTNGYTMKYAKLLDTDDQYAVNNYLRLWRQALKYAPSLIPVGLSQINQPTSNRKGEN